MAEPISTTTAIVMAVAAVGAVASAGITAYSMHQQAKTQRAIAQYNAQVAMQNATMNQQIASRQIEAQRAMVIAQQQGQRQDATIVRQQADTMLQQSREQARRIREEKMKVLARQRSAYASAGVLMEGSPLAVLSDTVGMYELQVADLNYKADIENRKYLYQANMMEHGADMMSINHSLLDLDEYAANTRQRIANRQAEIDLFAGLSQARGMEMQATATLISGVSNAAMGGYQIYASAPKQTGGTAV